jgi:predicted nuclease of restriction endonuclease-like (RecB) superfamily
MGKKKENVIFPVMPLASSMPNNYKIFLSDLKERIRKDRLRVVLASNTALVIMYWDIGQSILKKQNEQGWGSKVIDRLSADLIKEFPDMQGFSPRNLKYMRSFAVAWPDSAIVQQLAAQIPGFHNCILVDRVQNPVEREWYVRKTIEHGWSRNMLSTQLD